MSNITKVLIVVIGLVLVAFATELYLYFGVQKGSITKLVSKEPPAPTTIPLATPNMFIEDKNKLVLLKYLSLRELQKTQVEEWVKKEVGPMEIPAYSGPLPTSPSDFSQEINTRPTEVKVLVGFLNKTSENSISISQTASTTAIIKFDRNSRLISKDSEIIRVALPRMEQLLVSGLINQILHPKDLLLIPIEGQEGLVYKGIGVIVFR